MKVKAGYIHPGRFISLNVMANIVFAVKVLLMAVGLHLLISYMTDGYQDNNIAEPPWMGIEVETVPAGRLNWCNSTEGQVRGVENLMCNFHNLCFSVLSKHFYIFYHGSKPKGAELEVIPHYHTVPLTTAVGVSYWLGYYSMPYSYLRDDQRRFTYKYYSKGKYRIFSRITGTNTAHDIHDVLLPLFQTLTPSELQEGPSRTLICLFRDSALDVSEPLYRVLSNKYPIMETDFDFQLKESLYCFEDVTIGLPRDKLWYQWGLDGAPESPLSNLNITAEHVRSFTSYVISKMNVNVQCKGREHGVLLSRKLNRRLINENDLSAAISKKFNMPVVEISLERTPLKEIITTLACAKLAVGLHGAFLIFGMFLPRHSVLLEIFPYAINPVNHTPYKTMVSLPGMDIEYIAWRNLNKYASVLTEQDEVIFGISHLSEEEQEAIHNRTEVPPKLCCNDPEWKYRLYHHTIVDIPSVLEALENCKHLKKLNRNSEL